MGFSSDQPLVSNQMPISQETPPLDSPEFREFIDNSLKRNSSVMNSKVGGLYSLAEVNAFRQYFINNNPNQFRPTYRKVFDMVALNRGNIGAGATVTFPHGIVGLKSPAWIYANLVSTTPQYFSVVYPNVFLDNTNVTLVNPVGQALTSAVVVAEYLKT